MSSRGSSTASKNWRLPPLRFNVCALLLLLQWTASGTAQPSSTKNDSAEDAITPAQSNPANPAGPPNPFPQEHKMKCETNTTVDIGQNRNATRCCDERFEGHLLFVVNHYHLLKYWNKDEQKVIQDLTRAEELQKRFPDANMFIKENCSVSGSYVATTCQANSFRKDDVEEQFMWNARSIDMLCSGLGDRFHQDFAEAKKCSERVLVNYQSLKDTDLYGLLKRSNRYVDALRLMSSAKIILVLITAGTLQTHILPPITEASTTTPDTETSTGPSGNFREPDDDEELWKKDPPIEALKKFADKKNLEILIVQPTSLTASMDFAAGAIERMNNVTKLFKESNKDRLAPNQPIRANQLEEELRKLLTKQVCKNYTDCKQAFQFADDKVCTMINKTDGDGKDPNANRWLECSRNMTNVILAYPDDAEFGRRCQDEETQSFDVRCTEDSNCKANCQTDKWTSMLYCKKDDTSEELLPTPWGKNLTCKPRNIVEEEKKVKLQSCYVFYPTTLPPTTTAPPTTAATTIRTGTGSGAPEEVTGTEEQLEGQGTTTANSTSAIGEGGGLTTIQKWIVALGVAIPVLFVGDVALFYYCWTPTKKEAKFFKQHYAKKKLQAKGNAAEITGEGLNQEGKHKGTAGPTKRDKRPVRRRGKK